MSHEPFLGRRPVFIGDDVTDESVFAAMPGLGGIAFSVGRHAQGVAGQFDEPSHVRAWLLRLVNYGKASAAS
jgi:trehalose 6-phosphate phosphatase